MNTYWKIEHVDLTATWVRRAVTVPSRNVLTAGLRFVLIAVGGVVGNPFCESCGDYHVTTECVRKHVQDERGIFGSHKAS